MYSLPKNKYLSIKEAAVKLGLSTKTLRRWETCGKLLPVRTKGGHRRYLVSDLQNLNGKDDRSIYRKILKDANVKVGHNFSENVIGTTPVPNLDDRNVDLYRSFEIHPEQKKALKYLMSFAVIAVFTLITFNSPSLMRGRILNYIGENIPLPPAVKYFTSNYEISNNVETPAEPRNVLAAATANDVPVFDINIKSNFKGNANFLNGVNANDVSTVTLEASGDSSLTGNLTVGGNVDITGDITSPNTTFNLLNTGVTTLNLGGASSTTSISSTTGNTTINNNLLTKGTLGVSGKITGSGDLAISGASALNGTVNLSELTASSPVYTDSSKNLTSVAPSSGALGFWSRTGNVLLPTTTSDNVKLPTGNLTIGSGTPDTTLAGSSEYVGGTLEVDGHIGFGNWSAIDSTANAPFFIASSSNVLGINHRPTDAELQSASLNGIANYMYALNVSPAPTTALRSYVSQLGAQSLTNFAELTGNYNQVVNIGSGIVTNGYVYRGILGSVTTGEITNGYGLSLSIAGAINNTGISNTVTVNTTSAGTQYGVFNVLSNTGVVTSGTDNDYGVYTSVTRTGATGGTLNTYGNYITMTLDAAGAGTHNAYGLYIAGVSGADTNYSIYSAGGQNYFAGNVGIGDTTPAALLTVGNGDLFQVNSSGNITSIGGAAHSISNSANTLAVASVGDTTLTTGAASNLVNVLTGNLKVGNGTPSTTLGGESAYVEGTLETDGHVAFGPSSKVDGFPGLFGFTNYKSIIETQQAVTDFTGLDGYTGIGNSLVYAPAAPTAALLSSQENDIVVSGTAGNTISSLYGLINQIYTIGDNDVTSAYASYNRLNRNSGTGNITNGTGLYAEVQKVLTARGVHGYVSTNISTTGDQTGGLFEVINTAAVSSGTSNTYGAYSNVTRTGATGGTINTYGDYITMSLDNAGAGTHNAYGLYLANVTGADTNYSIYSAGGQSYFAGNVGIGDTTPAALLTVGNGDLFQVDASGNIVNIGGAAHSISNSSGALNIDSATTGAINIGTSGNAKTITVGNNTTTTALAFTSGTGSQTFSSSNATGTTTSAGFVFNGNSLTSGTGIYLDSSSLSTGKLANFVSTSTVLTGTTGVGSLLNLDWSPGSSTTSVGDLLAINAGSNAIVGNIFDVLNANSSVFSVGQAQITSALPHQFTAPGDVSIAYDIQLTNPVASFIKSQAPLYLVSGETFNSSDLTLRTYNLGNILLDPGTSATGTGKVGIGPSVTPSALLHVSNRNETTTIGQSLVIFDQGEAQDILTASASGTAKFVVDNSGNAYIGSNASGAANTGLCWNSASKGGATLYQIQDCPGTPADIAEWYAANIDVQPGDAVALTQNSFDYEAKGADPYTNQVGSMGTKTVNILKKAQPGDHVIGIISTGPFQTFGEDIKDAVHESARNDIKAVPMALTGRIPAKVDTSSSDIIAGDRLVVSNSGLMRAQNTGNTIATALESWTNSSGKSEIMVLLDKDYYVDASSINSSQSATDSGILSNLQEVDTTKLNVLGDAVLGDTVINGKLNVGALTFDNLNQSIDAIGVLKIQDLALGNVEFMNGLITFDTNGNVTVQNITANKYKIAGTSAGTSTIPSGQTSIFVNSDQVADNSLIFVTPQTKTNKVLSVTQKNSGSGFKVEITSADSGDINFSWWIVDKQ